jgi:hypothetical protein
MFGQQRFLLEEIDVKGARSVNSRDYILALLCSNSDLGLRCGRHALHSLTVGRLKLQP